MLVTRRWATHATHAHVQQQWVSTLSAVAKRIVQRTLRNQRHRTVQTLWNPIVQPHFTICPDLASSGFGDGPPG